MCKDCCIVSVKRRYADLRGTVKITMKILFCNIRAKYSIEGHRCFDIRWVNLMSSFADVTVLAPCEGWYERLDVKLADSVSVVVYDTSEILEEKKAFTGRNGKIGLFRRKYIAYKNIVNDQLIIKKIISLDEKEDYDFIVASTFNIFAAALMKKKIRNLKKLFVIEHTCDIYKKRTWRPFFNFIKDCYHHIVMESEGQVELQKKYNIKHEKIHYIPHMLNPIEGTELVDSGYDVVGISNSNSDEEIKAIIEEEETTHFLEKNNLHAIFRVHDINYDGSEYLKVFSGRLSLSYAEYNGLMYYAKVIIAPFGKEFGMRSSGTIQDAMTLRKPIIGSPFPTMLQYEKQLPNVCQTYNNIKELKVKILDTCNRKEKFEEEFARFSESHSNEFIIAQMKKAFQQYSS